MPAPTNRSAQRPPQRRIIYTGANRYDTDETRKPVHMAYRWLRISLGGQEDKENRIMAEMNGWTPVPASRHPELAGTNATDKEAIIRGGLMLVEQPVEYQREAREMEQFEARNNLEEQIQRLGLQARRNGAKGISRQTDVVDAEIVT